MSRKHVSVVAAVIVNCNKQILCTQRGASKYEYTSWKWEFPGGKIEPNETPENAIVREIDEELHMLVTVEKVLCIVNHSYPDFDITMQAFVCKQVSDSFQLTEHNSFSWLYANELQQLDWAAADLPIVLKIVKDHCK